MSSISLLSVLLLSPSLYQSVYYPPLICLLSILLLSSIWYLSVFGPSSIPLLSLIFLLIFFPTVRLLSAFNLPSFYPSSSICHSSVRLLLYSAFSLSYFYSPSIFFLIVLYARLLSVFNQSLFIHLLLSSFYQFSIYPSSSHV